MPRNAPGIDVGIQAELPTTSHASSPVRNFFKNSDGTPKNTTHTADACCLSDMLGAVDRLPSPISTPSLAIYEKKGGQYKGQRSYADQKRAKRKAKTESTQSRRQRPHRTQTGQIEPTQTKNSPSRSNKARKGFKIAKTKANAPQTVSDFGV